MQLAGGERRGGGSRLRPKAQSLQLLLLSDLKWWGGGEKKRKETEHESRCIKRADTHRAAFTQRCASPLAKSYFRRLPQRAASPTTAVHHFTPQLAEEKLKGK